MCYVKPFLERYPAEAAAFRKFVAEGRMQLVGGIDSMLIFYTLRRKVAATY